ncbi:MAG: FlgD immunoglobulin-like domain containing protein [Candidatus Eisenbacteria bacterium]
MRTTTCALVLGLVAASALSGAGSVLAAREADAVTDLRVQPPVSVAWDALGARDQVVATAALGDFSRETGSRWSVLDYAPGSLAPRLAMGTGLDLGRAILSSEDALDAARDLVATYPELFASRADRLELWQTTEGVGKYAVHFWETANGMPILGTKVTTVFTEDGVLAAFGSATFPEIEQAASPRIDTQAAFTFAHDHLRALGAIAPSPSDVEWRAEGPYVLPVVVGSGADLGNGSRADAGVRVEGHTIHRIVLWSDDPVRVWTVDVDAGTGEVLQRRNGLFHLDFDGTVTVDVEDPNYCEGAVIRPLSEVEVRIDGVGSALTGTDGTFTVPNAGTDPADLQITMSGPWFEVTNVDGPSALYQENVAPGTPIDILIDTSVARWDERDVYFHGTATHAMMKEIDAGWDDLDFVMPTRVNIDQGCNAFYSFADSSINFYRENGGCGNTGQIGDVVAHEYGHAITAELYGPNQPTSDLHEGNSDITANLLFGYSLIGPGFTLDDCENGIRDSDNDLVWPDDVTGSGHFTGQIIAGFYWNALQYLIATDGEAAAFAAVKDAWYFGRLFGLPQNQPEQAWYSILADDDNGNIDDGTPHFDALCQAAIDKGYDCPETFTDVVIKHTPQLYASNAEGDVRLEAEIYSLVGELAVNGVNLFWRPAGSGTFTPEPFSPTGEGNLHEAFIPTPPVLSSVDYYIFAEDEFGNSLRRPEGSGHFTFEVVTAYHNAEAGDGGWTVGDPNDTATNGVWERVDPNQMVVGGQIAQPGDDVSPDPGMFAWITEQYTGGSPVLSDADGITTLFSPVYDVTGSAWVHFQFMRWFQTLVAAQGGMEVAVTHDGGATWMPLVTYGPSDAAASWMLVSELVPEPIGGFGTVQFKIVALGAANPSIDECGLDEWVLIASDTGSPSSTPDETVAPTALRLALTTANPSRGIVGLAFDLPTSGAAEIDVFSVDGRRVRSLHHGTEAAGSHRVDWDGRDDLGRTVGSGVYFVRLAHAGEEQVRRVVIGR